MTTGTVQWKNVEIAAQKSPSQMPSQGFLSITGYTSVVIGTNQMSALPADFTAGTQLPAATEPYEVPSDLFFESKSVAPFQMKLSADTLSGYGLSSLSIQAADLVVVAGSTLAVAPGGKVAITTGSGIDIQGAISARSGDIKLVTDGKDSSFFRQDKLNGPAHIRVSGTLDTRGLWVNDAGSSGASTIGAAYLNGGNITLATNATSKAGGRSDDFTGDIILTATSRLDASSGGYIDRTGKFKVFGGVPVGTGGNITLSVSLGNFDSPEDFKSNSPPGATAQHVPTIRSDSGADLGNILPDIVRSSGFTKNGGFTLIIPGTINIGKTRTLPGAFWLPESLFSSGAFGSFTIQSVNDKHYDYSAGKYVHTTELRVANDTTLELKQNNYLPTTELYRLPTGGDVAGAVSLAALPDDKRVPVNLTLGSEYITIGQGVRINADPQASIVLRGDQVAGSTTIFNPAVSTLLLGKIVSPGGEVAITAQRLWMGPEALIDVSGTFVANSTFGLANGAWSSGTLLPGGEVTLNVPGDLGGLPSGWDKYKGAYLVGEAGATIRLNGAKASISTQDGGAVESWSDAGTLAIAAGSLFWDGSFEATAGDPRGNGGTLFIGGSQVYLSNLVTETLGGNLSAAISGLVRPQLATEMGNALPGNATGRLAAEFAPGLSSGTGPLHVTTDKLTDFDTMFLYSARGATESIFSVLERPAAVYDYTQYPLQTVGDVSWSVDQRLHIAADSIQPCTITQCPSPGTVTITAPYVSLTGRDKKLGLTSQKTGELAIVADTIDIEGAAFDKFDSVSLLSRGDIRLSTPRVNQAGDTSGTPLKTNPSTFTGTLKAPASLVLEAERIYPV
ncbi:MAG: hypothetical protein HC900_10825, partial [Methylacidiphilales bacterium]|nr:hypothetical protein [Candidatus Methylacidiphilales bacterium]